MVLIDPIAVHGAFASTIETTSWTSSDGRALEAHFMGLQGDGVLLKVPATGVTHIFPLAKLSPESQAQAKSATK